MTVPMNNMIAMAVTLVVCISLPVFSCIFVMKKENGKITSVLLGGTTFFVFAMILERIMHMIVLKSTGSFFQDHYVAYAVYGGIAAGVFEETGRFFTMKVIMKNYLTKKESVLYGIGHGGIEAILIGGLLAVSNLATSIALNSGQMNEVLKTGNEQIVQAITTLTTLPAWQFLLSGMERCTAFLLQITLSYFVYLAVKYKKIQWFLFAIFLHFLVDTGTLLLAKQIPILAIEIILLIFVLALAVWAKKMYQNEKI